MSLRESPAEETRTRPVRSRRSRLLVLLSVLGPGLIAAAAGNEAGGIVTYSNIGAAHGYSMLWLLGLSTLSLIVAQEMGTRMGIVTGKGLADLIREEFGIRVAVFALAVLFVANLFTTVSEIVGIRAAVEILAPGPVGYFLVPAFAGLLWLLVIRGTYRRVERVFLGMCLVYLAYVAAAFRARPDWGAALHALAVPNVPRHDPTYLRDGIALIGTTIAPWMQFYVQSSVRDKGLKPEHYAYERADVFLGSTLSNAISFFIVVACAATIFVVRGSHPIDDARQAAEALRQVAGSQANALFAIGLFNASAVGAVIVPLSTAYAVTEAIGSESGLGRKVREAPLFVGIFSALIGIATIVVLLTPATKLIGLIQSAQVLNGLLLPAVLILMLRVVNTRRLMGRFVNGPIFNAIAWLTVLLVVALSVASLLPLPR